MKIVIVLLLITLSLNYGEVSASFDPWMDFFNPTSSIKFSKNSIKRPNVLPKVTERTIGDVYEVLQKLLEVTMIQIVQEQNEEDDDVEVVMPFDGPGSAQPMFF